MKKLLYRYRQLSQVVPLSRQHVDRLERAGDFPRRVPVGVRGVAWLASEVEQWVADRKKSGKQR